MADEKGKEEAPVIRPLPNGPLTVRNLAQGALVDKNDEPIEFGRAVSLCRCGASAKKPFCDGAHGDAGFSSERINKNPIEPVDEYEGREITIRDRRGLCSHAGFCTGNLPQVFNLSNRPWIDPNAAEAERIIEVIEMCPSGALSYIKDGKKIIDREVPPKIKVAERGPYYVSGSLTLRDEIADELESKEHYTLCRCGASAIKPLCDGTHHQDGFNPENE